jgi:hypothetical protein
VLLLQSGAELYERRNPREQFPHGEKAIGIARYFRQGAEPMKKPTVNDILVELKEEAEALLERRNMSAYMTLS